MTSYSIKVIDERGRDLDAAMLRWELDGFRKVRVSAQFDGGNDGAGLTKFDTHPCAWVKVIESDEMAPGQFAVIELPENGLLGGIRTEFVAAFMDVIARATRIAADANERVKAEQAERDAAVPVPRWRRPYGSNWARQPVADRAVYEARRALIDHFRETLLSAAGHRRERDDFVPDPHGPCGEEVGWVVYERQQMHTAVNVELSRRGLPGVPVEDMLYIERQAAGHSDYVAQWAIRCADLVLRGSDA